MSCPTALIPALRVISIISIESGLMPIASILLVDKSRHICCISGSRDGGGEDPWPTRMSYSNFIYSSACLSRKAFQSGMSYGSR